ncbi:MAG TPA: YdcH family protein [Pyrinomonadaceae bacterium]|nr:YdcH family protein [Pyrinomonadaceae bacterium]
MDITNTESLKEQLLAVDPEFRELAREHGRYEQRLSELSSLQYPSDEEQLEEVTLKKKKLAVKDQMHAIMLKHQKAESAAH